jgi:hypothetical protein
MSASVHTLDHLADVARIQCGEPLTGLAVQPGAQRPDRRCGNAEGSAGPFGLGLVVRAH